MPLTPDNMKFLPDAHGDTMIVSVDSEPGIVSIEIRNETNRTYMRGLFTSIEEAMKLKHGLDCHILAAFKTPR